MTREIAFLAISQAHQFLHWLPAALRLAKEPTVEVTVLVSTQEGADFIRSHDPDKRLRIKRLWAPHFRPKGLFTPPSRSLVLLLNAWRIARYPTIVTTEVTSSLLQRLPGFRSRMVLLKHGGGDREGSYNRKHARFDRILANGPKHKEQLIKRGLATDQSCIVTGNSKFELVRPPASAAGGGKRLALYNPHFDRKLSSWFRHGREILRRMEQIADWNFVVAPHVKLRGGPRVTTKSTNVVIDRGSTRSIDMTYTQSAAVYIGDISSQVYEFIRTPRPCIFLNLDRVDWQSDPAYAHWHLGQVIESLDELPGALSRADELQPKFETVQRRMSAASIDHSEVPASERQAQAILDFAASGSAVPTAGLDFKQQRNRAFRTEKTA